MTKRDWAGGKVLQHSGSNTWNFATAWIAPQRDFAILACTNQRGDAAQAACDADRFVAGYVATSILPHAISIDWVKLPKQHVGPAFS